MTDADDYVERVFNAEMDRRREELRRGEIGIVPGTPVHTPAGLRPIEEIRAGDQVMSAATPGAALEPRRVARATHAPAQVVRMVYHEPGNRDRTWFVDTTLNHPFWVVAEGWSEARKLFSGFGHERRLLRPDGREMVASRVNLVFATEAQGIGWISSFANATDENGYEWDFAARALHRETVPATDDDAFRFEVHELHVEGSGIYFAGEHGLLVRRNEDGLPG
jgi:hypothetical protein